ncbi:MAG: putative lipid II flippase FtsW [Deltaproteobacteria bacterium]
MRTSGRGADHVDLDHLDWVEDAPPRTRSGDDRRRAERRRAAAAAPAAERRAGERRTAERRSSAGAATRGAAGERAASRPARQSARPATKPRTPVPGPGVAERRTLTLVTFLLVVYGLIMAYSASAAQAYFQYGSSFYFFGRQALWVCLGAGAMFVLSRVDYAWFRRAAVPLAGLALAGLCLVLVPGIGSSINGARRWLIVGGQGVQPSEFAKLACVVLVATLIVKRPQEVLTLKGFLKLVAVCILPAAALIMLEPDLGTTLVLVTAVVAVLVAAGAPLRYLFGLGAVGVAAVLALIAVEPYRLERLVTFFDPWKDPQGSGFQATQSLISIASGRVFGVGLGNSVQKFGFLPEQTTDMITGIIGEELGLVGLLVLLALYVALAWACFRIALNCKDLFGKLLATGITAMIVGQACINVGAALGLLPLTGVPLPLVSLGGTSMLVVLAGLGILLNIATNRRSHIAVSAQRRDGAAGGGRDRRSPAAGARRRG